MVRVDDSEASARMVLHSGVTFLHPEDAVFEAMLTGWERQQRGGRRLQKKTIDNRTSVIRRFMDYTNEYPWRWSAQDMDEWMSELVAISGRAESTIRNFQGAIRQFCDFITSPYYGWAAECETRFGTHPVQIAHEWNTVAHLVDYEGSPNRRPLTKKECQRLFDYADEQVTKAIRLKRKGALARYRDATLLKLIYAWGLRCNEASHLEVTDFFRNPKSPELGGFGTLQVRWGKRTKGSPPRRRPVLTVFPWAAVAVEDYLENVRPLYKTAEDKPHLWLTERGGRLQNDSIQTRFAEYRDALKMDKSLTPHCLRHAYVTHLIEDGTDPKFVQEQVGHLYASTTAIYTGVSGDFMNTMMRNVLDRELAKSLETR
ncbi:tyrosine-type recombinase/integrase [Catenulispora subtropica]|uniref:Tyr recombinase domain-containing protein n=1 Tax=Catenulispora subtropica TaxID=450798 RepID=A0ABN2QHY3_9ACTN